MEKFKILVDKNIKIKDLTSYMKVVSIAKENIYSNPDICIESCKSLIEGISKTLILFLDKSKRLEDIKNFTLEKLYKTAVDTVDKYNNNFETDFAKRFSTIVQIIGEIRNERGDISHGRPTPKVIESDSYLSKLIYDLTDSFLEYLLKHFFDIDISNEELQYDELIDYNNYLDSTVGVNFQMKKVTYSELLFENDFDMYKEIYYDEYYPNLCILESKEKENLGNLIYYLQKFKELRPDIEIKRKDEFQEKDKKESYVADGYVVEGYVKNLDVNEANNKNKLLAFTVENNLNFEKTRDLIDEKLSINKEPLRDEILQISNQKVSLAERGKVFKELHEKINQFIKTLE